MKELLATLYPIFKEEVYRRKARIGTITIAGAGVFLLGMLWFGEANAAFSRAERLVCAAGVGLFLAALLHQISGEISRHSRAKEALIRIERGLGLFDPGKYLPDGPLYPAAWETASPPGRAILVPRLVLGTLALLFVLEIFTVQ